MQIAFLDLGRASLCAIDLRALHQVISPGEVTPVPRVPEWLLGITPWREEFVPVVWLDLILGAPSNEGRDWQRPRHVFIEDSGSFLAVPVMRVITQEAEIVPSRRSELIFRGAVAHPALPDQWIPLLDASRLLETLITELQQFFQQFTSAKPSSCL